MGKCTRLPVVLVLGVAAVVVAMGPRHLELLTVGRETGAKISCCKAFVREYVCRCFRQREHVAAVVGIRTPLEHVREVEQRQVLDLRLFLRLHNL